MLVKACDDCGLQTFERDVTNLVINKLQCRKCFEKQYPSYFNKDRVVEMQLSGDFNQVCDVLKKL